MSNLSANTTHCSNVATDILVCNTGAVSVGMNIGTSVSPSMSGLSLSSNKLVITSGYSWLLECHMTIYSTSTDGSYTARWYNETDSAYVGQEAICARYGSGLRNQLRQTRKVCRALILASDFGANSSLTVYARVTAESGSANLSLSATYGEPCLKIVRIG
jgi:hypothetical protein